MRRQSPITRRALALLASLTLVFAAGCGGSDDAEPSANATPAPTVATFTDDGPAPTTLARRYLRPRIDPWLRYLQAEWGVKPKATWTTLKETSTRWRAQVQIAGDARKEKITAEWLIYLPLGSPSDLSDLGRSEIDGSIEAADDKSAELDTPPPPLPGNEAELSGSVEVTGRALSLTPNTIAQDASERKRRGIEAIGGRDDPASTVRVAPDATTRITDADGKSITPAKLRSLVDDPLTIATQVRVVWKLGRNVDGLADLEQSAPWSIKVLKVWAP